MVGQPKECNSEGPLVSENHTRAQDAVSVLLTEIEPFLQFLQNKNVLAGVMI